MIRGGKAISGSYTPGAISVSIHAYVGNSRGAADCLTGGREIAGARSGQLSSPFHIRGSKEYRDRSTIRTSLMAACSGFNMRLNSHERAKQVSGKRALGTRATSDCRDCAQRDPQVIVLLLGIGSRQSCGRWSGRCASSIARSAISTAMACSTIPFPAGAACTNFSNADSPRWEERYTTGTPFSFHRPPYRRAPSPERASSRCRAYSMRQAIMLREVR